MADEKKNQAPEAEQTDQQIQTGISFNDLVIARNVIQIASQRGAFTDPKEYQEIGALYRKLDGFVTSVQEQAQAHQAEEAEKAKDTKED